MSSTSSSADPGYWYDAEAADRVVNFIEQFCSHVKGHQGPFLLEDWQKDDIIRPLFGWKRADGRRKYRTCYIEIPRKNGKSNLTAAIALYEAELAIPVTDAVSRPASRLVTMVLRAFPELKSRQHGAV